MLSRAQANEESLVTTSQEDQQAVWDRLSGFVGALRLTKSYRSAAAVVVILMAHAASTALLASPPAQDTPAAPTAAESSSPAPEDGAAPSTERPPQPVPTGDSYRPIGPQLFPLYEHYLRTGEQTEVKNVLYLFRTTKSPRSSSTLFAPFYYTEHGTSRPSDRFYLFPLLYFSGKSEEESFRLAFPFYFDSQGRDEGFRFLAPAWLQTTSEGRQLTYDHVMWPFFRLTRDFRSREQSVVSSRFGLPWILDLWESRVTESRTELTGLNFFNWDDEAKSGLPMYRHSWSQDETRVRGRTYLFPFYWHRDDLDGSHLALIPLFLHTTGGGGTDLFLIPLLSRVGGGPGLEKRLNVLFPLFSYRSAAEAHAYDVTWPLFHYSDSPDQRSVAARPIFSYRRSNQEAPWYSLLGLYHQQYVPRTDKTVYATLFPLYYHNVEPDGSKGDRWYFPYYETYDSDSRWRFVLPGAHVEYQSLAGGEVDWFFRYGMPTYFSWGNPENYFGFGFPLYWESHKERRGWRVLAPLYYDFYAATSRGIYVVPLFTKRTFPSRTQVSTLWPLYVYERFYNLEREVRGSSHALLWPLTEIENRDDGYHYRFLPLGWISREGEERDMLLTPFYYQQWGPSGVHRYFIPFYGRYHSERQTKSYYALGSAMTSEERDLDGDTVRERTDLLWTLASFEKDYALNGEHTRVLPFYWDTKSPPVDRKVIAPLYYSHRILEQEKEHFLSLFLGNIFFSKVVEGPMPKSRPSKAPTEDIKKEQEDARRLDQSSSDSELSVTVQPPHDSRRAPAFPEADSQSQLFPIAFRQESSADAPANPLNPLSGSIPPTPSQHETEVTRKPPPRTELWRDQGVLWPLSRWYESAEDERGRWLIPFYFDMESNYSDTLALFPFMFSQEQFRRYSPNYFRYFFLYDRETWRGGNRWTIGQILFDLMTDESNQSFRIRLLYPMIEYKTEREGYTFEFTQMFHLSQRSSGGERSSTYRFFPIYWQGKTEREFAGDVADYDGSPW